MTPRATAVNPNNNNNNNVIIIGIPNYISSQDVGEKEREQRWALKKKIRRQGGKRRIYA